MFPGGYFPHAYFPAAYFPRPGFTSPGGEGEGGGGGGGGGGEGGGGEGGGGGGTPPGTGAVDSTGLLHYPVERQVEVIDRYTPKLVKRGGGRARWFGGR